MRHRGRLGQRALLCAFVVALSALHGCASRLQIRGSSEHAAALVVDVIQSGHSDEYWVSLRNDGAEPAVVARCFRTVYYLVRAGRRNFAGGDPPCPDAATAEGRERLAPGASIERLMSLHNYGGGDSRLFVDAEVAIYESEDSERSPTRRFVRSTSALLLEHAFPASGSAFGPAAQAPLGALPLIVPQ